MADFILSKEQLRNARKPSEDTNMLNEARNNRSSGVPSQGITVFLSHKHDEVAVLEDVICMLKSLGIYVYVDWLDEGMPKDTCGDTARRIKQKIKECKKFILLATEGAIASKWCNWELGYGDAQKYLANIAIMPITEKRRDVFSGSEYLQIYPVIKSDYEYIVTGCYVEFEGKRVSLVEWLKH
jgi:hypothetical protein